MSLKINVNNNSALMTQVCNRCPAGAGLAPTLLLKISLQKSLKTFLN